jgi:hypothetical protein
MKIRDVIVEQEAPDIMPQVKQDYQKGSKFVDKLLNPAKWFDSDGADAKKTATKTSASPSKTIQPVVMRDALNSAASGQVYEKDITVLKTIYSGVKSGQYKPADPQAVMQSLKTAIAGGQLSKEQAALLQDFSKQF